jgi:hypothetical protein
MNMVGELLRRQPGLEAKTWLDSTLNLGLTLDSDPDEEGEKITSAEWQDLWDFADWQHNVVGKEIWEGEEMEEGDEEDEDEEGDEEGVGEAVAAEEKGKGRVVEKAEPLMPLEDILRYLHSGGVLPVGGPPLTG